jgi:hypothetical protein
VIPEELFDEELARDDRIAEVTDEADRAWMLSGEHLLFALGIINYDDSVEVVLVRQCDPPIGHGELWPTKPAHCKWRISLAMNWPQCMDGTRLNSEQLDRIERAAEKAIRKAIRRRKARR